MSRPIVVIASISSSSESWEPPQHPHQGTRVPVEEPSTASKAEVSYFIQAPSCDCAKTAAWQGVAMSGPAINRKIPRRTRVFDPAVFLETAAEDRTIATHRKKGIIFS